MMAIRPLFVFVLGLAIALASIGHAVARHAPSGAQTLVICAPGGDQVIVLDARGNPVKRHPLCPDCVIAFHGASAKAADMPSRPAEHSRRLTWLAVDADRCSRPRTPAQARAPPAG